MYAFFIVVFAIIAVSPPRWNSAGSYALRGLNKKAQKSDA